MPNSVQSQCTLHIPFRTSSLLLLLLLPLPLPLPFRRRRHRRRRADCRVVVVVVSVLSRRLRTLKSRGDVVEGFTQRIIYFQVGN